MYVERNSSFGRILIDRDKFGLGTYSALVSLMINNEGGVHTWDLTDEQAHKVLYVCAHLLTIDKPDFLAPALLDRNHHLRPLHFLHQIRHSTPISPPSRADPLVRPLDHDPHLHWHIGILLHCHYVCKDLAMYAEREGVGKRCSWTLHQPSCAFASERAVQHD